MCYFRFENAIMHLCWNFMLLYIHFSILGLIYLSIHEASSWMVTNMKITHYGMFSVKSSETQKDKTAYNSLTY